MSINSVHWFRKGLRLHDNPALLEAARGSHTLPKPVLLTSYLIRKVHY
uniref:Photolyase/cryptochrome alpha/beta domain-containing protein n=1 Tax=Cyprinus carpio TaxID=7962 RepID=A0A8C2EIK9_CYPCA